MTTPLQKSILDLVTKSSDFQKVANNLAPTLGTIVAYDRDKQKAKIQYSNPTTGQTVSFDDVDVSKVSGFHHRVNTGDIVVIIFKEGNIHAPVVCQIVDDTPDIVAGYSTTKSSKGL